MSAMKDFIAYLIGTKRTARRVAARRIKKCFDGVKWDKQVFKSRDYTFEVDDETKFYKSAVIDEAMERLNSVLRDLSR